MGFTTIEATLTQSVLADPQKWVGSTTTFQSLCTPASRPPKMSGFYNSLWIPSRWLMLADPPSWMGSTTTVPSSAPLADPPKWAASTTCSQDSISSLTLADPPKWMNVTTAFSGGISVKLLAEPLKWVSFTTNVLEHQPCFEASRPSKLNGIHNSSSSISITR